MTNDDWFRSLSREAIRLHEIAPWLTVEVQRDEVGKPQARAVLNAHFALDPNDVAGTIIREIHRRLDEFESQLDE